MTSSTSYRAKLKMCLKLPKQYQQCGPIQALCVWTLLIRNRPKRSLITVLNMDIDCIVEYIDKLTKQTCHTSDYLVYTVLDDGVFAVLI